MLGCFSVIGNGALGSVSNLRMLDCYFESTNANAFCMFANLCIGNVSKVVIENCTVKGVDCAPMGNLLAYGTSTITDSYTTGCTITASNEAASFVFRAGINTTDKGRITNCHTYQTTAFYGEKLSRTVCMQAAIS